MSLLQMNDTQSQLLGLTGNGSSSCRSMAAIFMSLDKVSLCLCEPEGRGNLTLTMTLRLGDRHAF
jgi:hypothetical protein